MAVTIRDVAKEANVAPSTVSRVIADSPKISEETKKRVREVMEKLAYYPNFQAQSLAQNSTQTIGVIMPNSAYHSFRNPFFPEVLRGICTIAHASKFGIYLSTGATESEIHDEVVSMVQGRRVDGIVLLYSRANDKTIKYLLDADFPFTVVGRPCSYIDEITFVDNDNVATSKNVTNYLIGLGHRKIAFIGGNLDFVVNVDRLSGYKSALADAGIAFNEDYVVLDHIVKTEAQEAIKTLMSLETPPTALVTKDDLIAYELVSHLEELGFKVPDDISIVSFNNLMLSEHSKPPLSSVDINIYDLGYEATNCLIEKIKSPSKLAKHIIIPTKLIERKSCTRIMEAASIKRG